MNGTNGTAYQGNGRAKTLRVGIVLSGGQAPGMHVTLYLQSASQPQLWTG